MIYRDFPVGPQGTSFASQRTDSLVSIVPSYARLGRRALIRVAAHLAVVACLAVLAILNISVKGWTEVQDGVLWKSNGSDVLRSEVADGSPASQAGLKAGDALLSIDGRLIETPGRHRRRAAPGFCRRDAEVHRSSGTGRRAMATC